jgi:hypothetical protein
MTALREQLESRRAAEGLGPNPFYSTRDRVTVLRVEEASGEIWMLPWHHFIIGRHAQAGAGERLVLTFVAHEITLCGLNLAALIPEIANQRLESLRTAPGKYLKSAGNEPAIDQIQVRPLAAPTVGE